MIVHDTIDQPLIIGPDGARMDRPVVELSATDAEICRAYKRFKLRMGLKEVNYCAKCWNGNLADGMRGHVTDSDIVYECRCRFLVHQGMTI